ncbi:L-serine ammonia-lyase, iron-sulfur-dependent subunit beta [Halanaerocella petrolearia]
MSNLSTFDILGPTMVGPSSSHTAGAVRIGNLAREIVGVDFNQVKIYLHGSFKETYQGHGTDKALVGGLLGLTTDNVAIKESFQLAEEKELKFEFIPIDLDDVHPNTIKLEIKDANGEITIIVASSVGGGSVVIKQIDDIKVDITGEYYTVITTHQDQPGIVAKVTKALEDSNLNIAFMKVLREYKGALATAVIELDEEIDQSTINAINNISEINDLKVVGPVE